MKATAKGKMNKDTSPGSRKCPGENYEVSLAICTARQANNYAKCLLCSFYSGDSDDLATGDPKIKKSIFRANVIAGEVPAEINEYVMRKLGAAVGQFIKARSNGKTPAVVACDRRENSRNLSRIFGEGMKSAGMHAVHLGPAMPDMLRFAMIEHEMSAALFVSGCGARLEVNGVRIIDRDGRPLLFNTGIEKIGVIARRMKPGRSPSHGRSDTLRILPDYQAFMIERAPQLHALKVVLDGSYGIGGEIIPYVLAKTPLKVIRSRCEPDGRSELLGLRFPAGQVNTSMQQTIRSEEAHLGMATDYDSDLCVFYDEQGRALRSDIAAALIAREILVLKPGSRIAYDLRASAAFREEILRGGGQPLRTSPMPGGMNEAIIAKGAEYAFDISGRHLFKAFKGGESPLMALMLLCSATQRQQKPLSGLAEKMYRYAYSGVLSHEMPTPGKAASALGDLAAEFHDCEKDDMDGLTYRFPSWWFNVKHKPGSRIIALCVEGRTQEEERAGRHRVEQIIRQHQNQR